MCCCIDMHSISHKVVPLYFVKNKYQRMYRIEIVGCNYLYILCYIKIRYTVPHFGPSQ